MYFGKYVLNVNLLYNEIYMHSLSKNSPIVKRGGLILYPSDFQPLSQDPHACYTFMLWKGGFEQGLKHTYVCSPYWWIRFIIMII